MEVGYGIERALFSPGPVRLKGYSLGGGGPRQRPLFFKPCATMVPKGKVTSGLKRNAIAKGF